MSTLKIIENIAEDISWIRVLTLLDKIGERAAHVIYERVRSREALVASTTKSKFPRATLKSLQQLEQLMNSKLSKRKAYDSAFKFIEPFVKRDFPENWQQRIRDIKSLRSVLDQHEDIYSFISNLTLEPVRHKEPEKDSNAITLSTIHSAKGCEWKSVAIMGVLDGIMPDDRNASKKSLEEERRVLYVALTRAKDQLVISMPEFLDPGWVSFSRDSRFLRGLYPKYFEKLE